MTVTPAARRGLRLFLVNFEMSSRSKVLAWQRKVALALAARCERVVVLTESADDEPLPANVELHRVPLILQKAPFRWLGSRWLMLIPCAWWVLRARIDVCFVHMNMGWAYRLYALLKPSRIPIVVWYAHGTVTRQLRVAHAAADRVVTSSASGFRLPSRKLTIIGQGVDTQLFAPDESGQPARDVITVSRISARKRIDAVIDAFARMIRDPAFAQAHLRIVGAPLTRQDEAHAEELRQRCVALGISSRVSFLGHVSIEQLPACYRGVALHINLSETGSMDKTVLESLACGCPVLTSNQAFEPMLRERAPLLFLGDTRPEAVAAAATQLLSSAAPLYSRPNLRALVVGHHDLASFVEKLMAVLEAAAAGK